MGKDYVEEMNNDELVNVVYELMRERDSLRAALYDWVRANGPGGWIDVLRKDAERYRWLRNQYWEISKLCVVARPKDAVKIGHWCPSGKYLDDVVDEQLRSDHQ